MGYNREDELKRVFTVKIYFLFLATKYITFFYSLPRLQLQTACSNIWALSEESVLRRWKLFLFLLMNSLRFEIFYWFQCSHLHCILKLTHVAIHSYYDSWCEFSTLFFLPVHLLCNGIRIFSETIWTSSIFQILAREFYLLFSNTVCNFDKLFESLSPFWQALWAYWLF